jgi:hypothetical protein
MFLSVSMIVYSGFRGISTRCRVIAALGNAAVNALLVAVRVIFFGLSKCGKSLARIAFPRISLSS